MSTNTAALDDYLRMAESSRQQGQIEHARWMVAAAVSLDPTHPGALKMADELSSERPPAPQEEGEFFGITALRARCLWIEGELRAALVALLHVTRFRPEVPYLLWFTEGPLKVLNWPQHLKGVPLDRLGPALASWMNESPEILSKAASANGKVILRLIESLIQLHPEHQRLQMYRVIVLRKLGLLKEAKAAALEAYDGHATWLSAITLANVERALSNHENAIEILKRARDLDPSQESTTIDIGDILLDLGRHQEAIEEYGKILAHSPEHFWALPSSHYAELKETGSEEARNKLEKLAKSGASERAQALLIRLEADPS